MIKRISLILFSTLTLLLIPLIAMQFSPEVQWSTGDFILAGLLLLTTGLILDMIVRRVSNPFYKIIFIVSVILILLLVWLELAVGIFGTPFAGT